MKKEYVLEIINRKTGEIFQTEKRKTAASFDRLWCKALSNVNQFEYKLRAKVDVIVRI